MKNIVISAIVICVLGLPAIVYGHCEIPCGIYDDQMRIKMIEEDIVTIEKSMNMIEKLSDEEQTNYNQIVRWVDNKETHAGKIQEIVFQYFMTQRIKSVDPGDKKAQIKYNLELQTLHQIAVEAMKAKQSTDVSHVNKMRELVEVFSSSYFEEKK